MPTIDVLRTRRALWQQQQQQALASWHHAAGAIEVLDELIADLEAERQAPPPPPDDKKG